MQKVFPVYYGEVYALYVGEVGRNKDIVFVEMP